MSDVTKLQSCGSVFVNADEDPTCEKMLDPNMDPTIDVIQDTDLTLEKRWIRNQILGL